MREMLKEKYVMQRNHNQTYEVIRDPVPSANLNTFLEEVA